MIAGFDADYITRSRIADSRWSTCRRLCRYRPTPGRFIPTGHITVSPHGRAYVSPPIRAATPYTLKVRTNRRDHQRVCPPEHRTNLFEDWLLIARALQASNHEDYPRRSQSEGRRSPCLEKAGSVRGVRFQPVDRVLQVVRQVRY